MSNGVPTLCPQCKKPMPPIIPTPVVTSAEAPAYCACPPEPAAGPGPVLPGPTV